MGGYLDPARLAKLRALRSGGRPAFPDLARAFLDNARTVLADLRGASLRGGPPQWSALLHKLKGSSAMIGAEALTARTRDLEASLAGDGPAPDPAALEAGLAGLEAEFAAVARELEAILAEPGS